MHYLSAIRLLISGITLSLLTLHLDASPIDSLRKTLPNLEGSALTKVYSDLCWEYRFENVDSAFYFGNAAIRNATKTDDKQGLAQAYNDLAIIHIFSANLSTADSLLLLALEIEHSRKDTMRVAAIQNKLAIIAQKRGDLKTALSYNLKTLPIYELKGDLRSASMILNNIAVIHNNLNEKLKAREVLREVYHIKMQINDSSEAAGTLVNLGNSFEDKTSNDSAYFYYELALDMLLKCKGSPEYIAGAYNSMARIDRVEGSISRALEHYKKALEFRTAIRDKHALSVTYSNLADLYLQTDQFESAKTYLDSAFSLAKKAESNLEKVGILRSYSAFYEQMDDASKTFEFATRAFELKDSILGEESRKAIAEAEAKYESVKKMKEIAQLNEQKAQTSLNLARQRNWIIILVAALLLVAGSAWFLYYRKQQYSARQLADKELLFNKQLLSTSVMAQEEERQRIAKEIHDGLVQSIAALKLGVQNAMNEIGLEKGQNILFQNHLNRLDETANEARNISHQMMPRALMEAGLVSAMEDMLDKTLGKGRFSFSFEHFGIGSERFEKTVEIGLYRIAQEMVNNIIRHSGAEKAIVQLYKTKTHLILHVEDDGAGFELYDKSKQSGMGLNNIFSRASAVNGEVNYERVKPKGTVANVRVPLK